MICRKTNEGDRGLPSSQKQNTLTAFTPGRGDPREDWDEVSENPEQTEEEIKSAESCAEAFSDLHASLLRLARSTVEMPG